MRKTWNSLHDQLRAICQPNPQVYKDLSIYPVIWNRNVLNLYISLIFILVSIVNGCVKQFSTQGDIITLGYNFLVIMMFLLLCRSYIWVFNLLYTVCMVIIGSGVLGEGPDGVYYHVGFSFILLPFIWMRTGDIKMSSFIAVAEILTYLTSFRRDLIVRISDEEPEVFADKFIKITLFWYVAMIVVSFSVLMALDRKAIELSRAKSAIEAALDNQKTFIFSFSHELRNPINSLLGNLQLVLQGEVLSAKATQMIEVAKICGEILLHGINNVLETGKREMGKLEVNPVPTHIHEFFQKTWGIYGELLKQKKLESELKIDQGVPHLLKIDAQRVNQMLLNLIGNSIKFTEKGSISVACKWLKIGEVNDECFEPIPYDDEEEGLFEKDENLLRIKSSRFLRPKSNTFVLKDGKVIESQVVSKAFDDDVVVQKESAGVLKIIVKDTGSGMKKEALNKLFQKFSQVSENVSQRQIGTGLGLFITKEICNTMGGEIRAYSKLGTGTTFVVCIPTVALPSDPSERIDTPRMMKSLSHWSLKAIVADDSPFNVTLISDYFSKFRGSVVSIGYNGYDALTKYKDCRSGGQDLDVVVLDIDMPIMDGKAACERIRQYEKDHNLDPVVVILISGNYGKEQIDDYIGKERGQKADCFLKKPVSFAEFSRAVYNCVVIKKSIRGGCDFSEN